MPAREMNWESRIKLTLAIIAVLGGTAGMGVVWGETKALLKRLTEIAENHEARITVLEKK